MTFGSWPFNDTGTLCESSKLQNPDLKKNQNLKLAVCLQNI